MEVDPPSTSAAAATTSCIASLSLNPLKRSNSAPMINVLGVVSTASEVKPSTSCQTPPPVLSANANFKSYERVRRFSTSSMALNTPSTPVKVPSRLYQIKREETMPADREVAHERETQSAMQMSHSWEELSLEDNNPDAMVIDSVKRPKSFGEPLHIFTSTYPYASSPSPTRDRVGKQCFSPSLQQHVRNNTLTPSPSPSPTRKTFARRSLSPTVHAMRPSPLGGTLKRKQIDLDSGERPDMYFSPPKRFQPSNSPGGSTPDRIPLPCHPLIHSISSSSLSDNGSPEQRVPNVSTSTTTTSFSDPSLMGPYAFRPVRRSTDSRGTDSETSDMTEANDIADQTSHTDMHVTPPSEESGRKPVLHPPR